MSMKSLEQIPWFSVAGAVLLVSLFLFTSTLSNFMTELVPIYLTEALLFIVFGYALMRGHTEDSFTVFLMACVWLLDQILCWSNIGAGLSASLWFLAAIQIVLAYLFLTKYKLKFANVGGEAWTYAALWVIFLFGVAKLWLNLSYGTAIAQMPIWGISIAILSFGYIIKPLSKDAGVTMQAIGALLAVFSALTIGGAGLLLVP
jgi:hypothetical protein